MIGMRKVANDPLHAMTTMGLLVMITKGAHVVRIGQNVTWGRIDDLLLNYTRNIIG